LQALLSPAGVAVPVRIRKAGTDGRSAIANQSTLDGDDHQPACLEGYGVINADHARDLADQSHTTTRRMGNTTPGPGSR
jgi:hypothetical protein